MLAVFSFSLAMPVFAQTPSPSATPNAVSALADSVQSSQAINSDSFVGDVMSVIDQWKGGIPLGLKIACVVLLLIASMKVSFIAPLWNKLGNFQAFMAPLLGLILGLTLLGSGGPITIAAIFAYLASGAGAIALHELLDAIKAIPGIGTAYVAIINVIEGALGGSSAKK